jgi:hypothetical protein
MRIDLVAVSNWLGHHRRRLTGRPSGWPEHRIDRADEVGPLLYFAGPSPVFLLPPAMLVMQGAHRYGPGHPLVRGLAEGAEAMLRFYEEFAPADLAAMYRLPRRGRAGEELPPWTLPWLLRDAKPPAAEGGLPVSQGVSYYGPWTQAKAALEKRRLDGVRDAIARRGYRPAVFGHIEGHFLRRGGDVRFFVRGGKHRAAALVHLGWDRIPVRVRSTWPRLIDDGTESDWPLVRSGAVDAGLARDILQRYFET